jgi:hypothetical protein
MDYDVFIVQFIVHDNLQLVMCSVLMVDWAHMEYISEGLVGHATVSEGRGNLALIIPLRGKMNPDVAPLPSAGNKERMQPLPLQQSNHSGVKLPVSTSDGVWLSLMHICLYAWHGWQWG